MTGSEQTPLLEDAVKTAVHRHLEEKGYIEVDSKMGTRQGYDVEGVNPATGRRLVVECKGEARRGSQHARSWPNVASALLTAAYEIGEDRGNEVGLAFPDTPEYHERCRRIKGMLDREGIRVFWVGRDHSVTEW